MTWLEFKRKVVEVTSRPTTEAVPIMFLHCDKKISPDDITVCCGVTGEELALIVVLKEGGAE